LIGRELVLGVGYMLLTSGRVADIIAGIGTGQLKTKLQTFGDSIDVDIEGLQVTLDSKPIPDRVQYYLAGLKVIAQQHAANPLTLPDFGPIIDDEFVPRVRAAVEKSMLEYSYRIRYKHVYVSTSTMLRKGHLRKVVNLLCPVGQVMGLQFVTDAQERCGKTFITTSLWIDYCVGRREGPIVRRVAEREIGCREDAMLYRLERVVYDVVTGKRDVKDLRKIKNGPIPANERRAYAPDLTPPKKPTDPAENTPAAQRERLQKSLIANLQKRPADQRAKLLAIAELDDQNQLAKIAQTHDEKECRDYALMLIVDQPLLGQVVLAAQDAKTRSDAAERITAEDQQLVIELLQKTKDHFIYRDLLNKLQDQELRRELYRKGPAFNPAGPKVSDWLQQHYEQGKAGRDELRDKLRAQQTPAKPR
jgi:hypothetical protein